MKHVVTGGCGFIGSHLVDSLIDLGHEVVVLDDLSTSEGPYLNPAATLVQGSVTDPALVASVTEGAGCVFHTAAWARIPRSIQDPIGTHNVNVNGTLNVLQAARENGVPRVVYSSSSSVYGDQSHPRHAGGHDPRSQVALRPPEAHRRAVRQPCSRASSTCASSPCATSTSTAPGRLPRAPTCSSSPTSSG